MSYKKNVSGDKNKKQPPKTYKTKERSGSFNKLPKKDDEAKEMMPTYNSDKRSSRPYQNSDEKKEQKQQAMLNFEKDYEEYLVKRIEKTKTFLLNKYPTIKSLIETWVYGVYFAIFDHQQLEEKKGKLYFVFENIPEKDNKYKISYTIDENNNCIFKTDDIKNFPKPYITILKRHHFDFKKETSNVSELICAHMYKFDEMTYVYHSDCNKLNNSIKNLIPLEKELVETLTENYKKDIAKAQQYIPEKYKVEFKNKSKEIIKYEYRACDLYFNHNIAPEKIAATLRNRFKPAEIERTVKLYSYFRIYATAKNKVD